MLEFFQDFFSNKEFFTRTVRAILLGAGVGSVASASPDAAVPVLENIPPWLGVIFTALGGAVAAGEKNSQ